MKKLIAIVLAVMLAVSCTIAVSAANATPGTTTLTTSVPDAEYQLNIPADQEIVFGAEETDIGSIAVTNASGFAIGKNLKVTLDYDAFSCENVTTTIPFAIEIDCELKSAERIPSGSAIVFRGKDNGSVDEFFINQLNRNYDITNVVISSEDWGKALAGDYTATITFSAEVVAE